MSDQVKQIEQIVARMHKKLDALPTKQDLAIASVFLAGAVIWALVILW
jgi:hypothetical protein